jgi:small conductance mechanosensitive channel
MVLMQRDTRHSAPSIITYLFCLLFLTAASAGAQQSKNPPIADDADKPFDIVPAERIPLEASTPDADIAQRIQQIFAHNDRVANVRLAIKDGVAILSGDVPDEHSQQWIETIAERTEGVVAVVNNTVQTDDADKSDMPTIAPVLEEGHALVRQFTKALPILLLSLAIAVVVWLLARLVSRWAFSLLDRRINSLMLSRLVARLCALPILLVGIYLILNITGLNNLAATVIGGTGLLGLIIGFAFRDIAENFLASILISLQRPFRLGDTIEVLNFIGVVQAVTTRGTILMTLDGNHVQIPNTIIYKEPIINYSANPGRRLDFTVGIGYDASISRAQDIAMQTLLAHPAVSREPEPMVLAEALSASTVNMRIYFWVDSSTHSIFKVKSAAIRIIKHAFTQHGISMPDDAREVIFPEGIQVITKNKAEKDEQQTPASIEQVPAQMPVNDQAVVEHDQQEKALCTPAEGELTTETSVIKKQAEKSTLGEGKTTVLK